MSVMQNPTHRIDHSANTVNGEMPLGDLRKLVENTSHLDPDTPVGVGPGSVWDEGYHLIIIREELDQ